MDRFFCAEASQRANEDLIGTGVYFQTYILIECCYPWAADAFASDCISERLRGAIAKVKTQKQSVRCLLINRNETKNSTHTNVLIYQHQLDCFYRNYSKREFSVQNLDQAAQVIEDYIADHPSCYEIEPTHTRDILICTHGSHDQCCARYGNPFYAKATAIVTQRQLNHIRVWRASHFGGHRFAPTAIDLPDGRYYGRLDTSSFKSILMRTGNLQYFNSVYRGWSVLPSAGQVIERSLIFSYGWEWFNCQVACRVFEQAVDGNIIQAELLVKKPDGTVNCCRATVVKDEAQTVRLKGSCHAKQESEFVKYGVKSLMLYSDKLNSDWLPFSARSCHEV